MNDFSFILFTSALWASVVFGGLDPDVNKTIEELVTENGYPIERHVAVTEDGYMLTLFRIPHGRNEAAIPPGASGKPPVLLQHGLTDSAYTWIVNNPQESLGFILADAGFDVWMGNNRGNRYSKQNINIPNDSDLFWNFCLDDMGRSDVPAMVDFILAFTNKPQLGYVAHSEGTTQMFAAPHFDKYNELPKKIAFFGGMAPVAYVSHTKSPMIIALAQTHTEELFKILGLQQFLPGTFIDRFSPEICSLQPHLCDDVTNFICGPSTDLNETRLQVLFSGYPAGTSVKNSAHWAQHCRKQKFEMFDYGSALKNQAVYGFGHFTPPQYDLSKLKIPMVLYSGSNDWLADATDVAQTVSELDKDFLIEHVVVDGYAHGDFTWGIHAYAKVYKDLIGRLKQWLGAPVLYT